MMRVLASTVLFALGFGIADRVSAQSLGNAGTIEGTVVDATGAVVAKAQVTLRNAVSGYTQTVQTGTDGSFRLVNIPPNPYRLEIKAPGFSTSSQNVDVRNSIPIQ